MSRNFGIKERNIIKGDEALKAFRYCPLSEILSKSVPSISLVPFIMVYMLGMKFTLTLITYMLNWRSILHPAVTNSCLFS